MKKIFTKTTALFATLAIVASMFAVPSMAATVDSLKLGAFYGSLDNTKDPYNKLTGLTLAEVTDNTPDNGTMLSLDAFKTLYGEAGAKRGIMTFEANTFSANDVYNTIIMRYFYDEFGIPVTASTAWKKWTRTEAEGAYYSSGSYGVILDATKVRTFTFGSVQDMNTSANNANVPDVNERVTAVSFVASSLCGDSSNNAGGLSVKATFSDDTSKTIASAATATEDVRAFFGIQAPSGTYIKELELTKSGDWVVMDDFGFVMGIVEPKNDIPATVEITAPDVYEPAYNSFASYALTATVKDTDGNVLENEEVEWAVVSGSATIAADGTLTVKRAFDAAVGQIVVSATAKRNASATAQETISAISVAPFFAKNMKGNATEYEQADFVKDFAKATNKAAITFEKGNLTHNLTVGNGTSGDITGTVPMSPSGNLSLSLTSDRNGTRFRLDDSETNADTTTSGSATLVVYQGKINLTLIPSVNNLKITAIGFAAGHTSSTNAFTVNYTDGSSKLIDVNATTASEKNFYGAKAPVGKYIASITMNCTSAHIFDDICVILEDTNSTIAPRFSLDAKGYKVISSITDAASAESIYVALPADADAEGKMILAVYGGENNGNELLGVNCVDLSTGNAAVTIEEGKTVKTIKMFIWDSLQGLVPINDEVVIK